jgi:hypothetical protein
VIFRSEPLATRGRANFSITTTSERIRESRGLQKGLLTFHARRFSARHRELPFDPTGRCLSAPAWIPRSSNV